jgi:predicted Fe-Mo cluster-binding NifX family protein
MTIQKIAIPSESDNGLTSRRSGHFGRSPFFTIVELKDGVVTEVSIAGNVPHTPGSCLEPVFLLKGFGVDTIVVSGMGAGPYKRIGEYGITVLHAAQEQYPDVQSAVDAVINEALPEFDPGLLCRKEGGNCHHHVLVS